MEKQIRTPRFIIQKPRVSVSQNSQTRQKNFTITKKIAKHGDQSIIIIPRMLEQHLKPGMTIQLGIDILENPVLNLEDGEK